MQFIVAEISKGWTDGIENTRGSGLLCQQFEKVISHNLERGYRLHSFQLHQTVHQESGKDAPVQLNETIIAVFERQETPHAPAL